MPWLPPPPDILIEGVWVRPRHCSPNKHHGQPWVRCPDAPQVLNEGGCQITCVLKKYTSTCHGTHPRNSDSVGLKAGPRTYTFLSYSDNSDVLWRTTSPQIFVIFLKVTKTDWLPGSSLRCGLYWGWHFPWSRLLFSRPDTGAELRGQPWVQVASGKGGSPAASGSFLPNPQNHHSEQLCYWEWEKAGGMAGFKRFLLSLYPG